MQFTIEREGFTRAHTLPPHVTQLVFNTLNNHGGFEHRKFRLTCLILAAYVTCGGTINLLLVTLLLCTKKAMYAVICILHAGSANPVLLIT